MLFNGYQKKKARTLIDVLLLHKIDNQFAHYHRLRTHRVNTRGERLVKTLPDDPNLSASAHAAGTFGDKIYPIIYLMVVLTQHENWCMRWRNTCLEDTQTHITLSVEYPKALKDGMGRVTFARSLFLWVVTAVKWHMTWRSKTRWPLRHYCEHLTLSSLYPTETQVSRSQEDLALMIKGIIVLFSLAARFSLQLWSLGSGDNDTYFLQAGAVLLPGRLTKHICV